MYGDRQSKRERARENIFNAQLKEQNAKIYAHVDKRREINTI